MSLSVITFPPPLSSPPPSKQNFPRPHPRPCCREGYDCTDYTKLGSSYGQCIRDALGDQLLNWFGCIPPWFPYKSGNFCYQVTDKSFDEAKLFEITTAMYSLTDNEHLDFMKNCLQPCTTLKIGMGVH